MHDDDVKKLSDDMISRITRVLHNTLDEWPEFPPDALLNCLGAVRGQVIRDYATPSVDNPDITIEGRPADEYLPSEEDDEEDDDE